MMNLSASTHTASIHDSASDMNHYGPMRYLKRIGPFLSPPYKLLLLYYSSDISEFLYIESKRQIASTSSTNQSSDSPFDFRGMKKGIYKFYCLHSSPK